MGLTADIGSAYVSNNPVPVASLPELIESVNLSLSKIGQPAVPETPELVPAVNPRTQKGRATARWPLLIP
ncbi:MucR family transcriptional regulator [Mesorhizobium waimense]|uniref:MucR family transcriptional regulator n=1 Tax=Mesorhizobium waimense TaxID=1300307 RepID=UPI00315C6723